MTPVKNQLIKMIDCMQEPEQLLLFEFAKKVVSGEMATPDDLIAIQEARSEYMHGETVNHHNINWD